MPRDSRASALGCDLAAEVAGKFGRVRVRAWGTSMAPAIHPGDLVWVERAVPEEVCIGEIVAFVREGRLFVHRLAAKVGSRLGEVRDKEPCLITRGDRLRQNDAAISDAQLMGRVTHLERGGARVPVPSKLSCMQQAIGFLLRSSDRLTVLYLRCRRAMVGAGSGQFSETTD